MQQLNQSTAQGRWKTFDELVDLVAKIDAMVNEIDQPVIVAPPVVLSRRHASVCVVRSVDGKTYMSYRRAWDVLGYKWNGSNPSFNARLALKRLGHVVGPPTR